MFIGKTLLERQISTLKKAGISDIAIATGYRGELIKKLGFNCYHNVNYKTTNMVNSLFNALPFIEKKGEGVTVIAVLDRSQSIPRSLQMQSVDAFQQWWGFIQRWLRKIDESELTGIKIVSSLSVLIQ